MNDLTIRKLQKEDLTNGFLQTLDSLRQTSNTDKKTIEKTFEKINSNQDQLTIVALLEGKVVGATTLLIETKFIHNGGKVGHIEDVVVNKKYQKKGIGEKMIKYLLRYAKEQGCYKTILDCVDDVKPFYEKLGFKHNANALRFDHT
ncbi:GNAT family N-acetyltransferase [Nitrosarchaeum koreense]|uniref:glucosamine-phosphate N-acetyltransferase n=1 Tax=Nitrosarchaeum koreense MY1 TaxID=1001994 RepID=F9CVJ1_9ARCH|nr:GNAT family N-acetyltransferase [Nitrosarchaeum koreense]EGP93293.1 GCN5-related N-acetyltransferase [Nitrosarchaeum koreense MY1]